MKLLNFLKREKTVTNNDFYRGFFGDSLTSNSVNNPTNFLNSYTAISYVGKCVSLIAGDIAKLNFGYFLNDKRVENKELDNLFFSPTQTLNNNEFMAMIVSHLLLDGNIFLLLDSQNMSDLAKNRPTALLPIVPSTVDIYSDKGRSLRANDIVNDFIVDYYQCNIGNSTYQLPKNKVLHIKRPSPFNPIRGIGIIQENKIALESDKIITDYNISTFERGGTSRLVYNTREMGQQDFTTAKKQVNDQLRVSSGGLFLINGKEETLSAININHTDLQFIEQKKMSREDIRAMFGLPAIITGEQSDINRANADEQLKVYRELVLPRYYSYLEAGFTNIVKLFDKRLVFKFIIKPIIDVERLSPIASNLFDRGIFNGNEVRTFLGLETVNDKNLDQRFITMQYMPIDYQPPVKAVASTASQQTNSHKQYKATQKQASIIRIAKISKAKIELDIITSINKYFTALEKKVLAQFEDEYKSVKALDFDFDEEVFEAKKASKRFFTSGITLGINDVNKLYNNDYDGSFKNPKIRLVIDRLSTRYADRVIDTRKNEVLAIITKGNQEGLPYSEIKGLLQDNFAQLNGAEGWKAWRIARTEASSAWDAGARLDYEDIGVKTVDIVGCEDSETDCNSIGIPIAEADGLEFHPNHTGTMVPSDI